MEIENNFYIHLISIVIFRNGKVCKWQESDSLTCKTRERKKKKWKKFGGSKQVKLPEVEA